MYGNTRALRHKRSKGRHTDVQKKNVILNRRRKTALSRNSGVHDERDYYTHGISNNILVQGVVSQNVQVSHRIFQLRNVNKKSSSYIPGDATIDDKLFSILPGDPLFTTRELLEGRAGTDAFVFSAITGMSHRKYTTAEDFDQDLIFMGFASETSIYGDISVSRVRLTTQIAVNRTVLNNGPDMLLGGDMLGYITPYFNKNKDGANYIKPDREWQLANVGSTKVERLLPQLRKISPFYIAKVHKHMFATLLVNLHSTSNNREDVPKMFPTSKYITNTNLGNTHITIDDFTPIQKLSMLKLNDAAIGGLHMIDLLMQLGFLKKGNKFSNNDSSSYVLEKISAVIGFYETKKMEREDLHQIRNSYLKKWINRYFYKELSPSLKNVIKQQMRHFNGSVIEDEGFLDALTKGSFNGEHLRNSILYNRLRSVIGVCTRGGVQGTPVIIDSRMGYSL